MFSMHVLLSFEYMFRSIFVRSWSFVICYTVFSYVPEMSFGAQTPQARDALWALRDHHIEQCMCRAQDKIQTEVYFILCDPVAGIDGTSGQTQPK